MSTGLVRPCEADWLGGGHVHWARACVPACVRACEAGRAGEGMSTGPGTGCLVLLARGAAWRWRRDLLGGHHQRELDYDVGVPGADGAAVLGARHQFAQGVRQPAGNPVPDHHAGAGLGGSQELLGRRFRGTHPFILGPLDSRVRTRVTPG